MVSNPTYRLATRMPRDSAGLTASARAGVVRYRDSPARNQTSAGARARWARSTAQVHSLSTALNLTIAVYILTPYLASHLGREDRRVPCRQPYLRRRAPSRSRRPNF